MSLEVALERIHEAQKNHASELDLSELGLTEIPMEIFRSAQLTYLNLSSNQLTEIKGLEKFTQLTYLNLSSNQLTETKGLEKLIQLIYLNLSFNQLIEIKGLEHLSQLTELNLSFNHIKETSDIEFIIQNNKLSYLNILSNSFEFLTEKIYLFFFKNAFHLKIVKELKNIVVKKNNFEDAAYLRDIEHRLSGTIHYSINEEDNIFVQGVLLDNLYKTNPIKNPPFEIIKQGRKAIQEYFSQRKKSGEELLNEAKLILLGDGRSGKTSLANRLLSKELPKDADRTQGVDIVIGAYSFLLANGKDFKINIWDFAGQDKYKTLHQLFYTESSLYIMVAESGNMTTDYDDWFQAAALFGEGSPLVLVLNEFKEGIGMGSFDNNYWKKQFPELLKEVFTVNLGTKQNFSAVEEYIRLLAQTLPHTKYAFPSNWAAIRRVLNSRRNEQYITLKEYFEICKNNNLPERESALILSSVLHKVGDCLHYQKSELLKQFIILKNEWATEAVYKILDDKVVAEDKCGFFDLLDLERIWSSPEYEDMRPQLLELMKQFKLAYPLPGREEFVTPPLLPPASPVGFVWPELNSLELYIEYEFLPKALLTQFIVNPPCRYCVR